MTTVDSSAIEKFRADLHGTAHTPGEEGYDEGRKAFNLNAHEEPALVVVAGAAADIVAAVKLAWEQGLGVGVLATGHGMVNPCDGGVLVNTSGMRGVSVDAESQTARVEPGVLWSDVIPEAQAHGLMGLAGSSEVQSYLAYVAEATRPYQTGATYADFLELDGATPEHVKAAYSDEDWERLVSIKDRYDPGNTFRFDRNIPPS